MQAAPMESSEEHRSMWVGMPHVSFTGPDVMSSAKHIVADFERIVRAQSRAEILEAIVDAAVSGCSAGGAAVVEIDPNGDARVVLARGVGDSACLGEVDVIDAHVGDRLLERCRERYRAATTLPLTSGGDLFGALILFFSDEPTREARANAEALAGMATAVLGKAAEHEALRRAYAELRASRELLERTEKLRALGEMSAGIAHDLKNILNPLSLHLQLLRRILQHRRAGAEEAIGEMEQVLRRGVETVDRLRQFSKHLPEGRLTSVELNPLAHEAAQLARPRIAATRRPRGIRIVEELGAPPPILASGTDLVAALLNLISNSIDALENGGTVTVSTGEADGTAWIRVHDDGPGIPAELRDRIFEPFFTTKGAHGTGLGLAMVHACVERHRGTIALESAPGDGTTFTVRLPAAS
jgi:signal transduction histidine kinase